MHLESRQKEATTLKTSGAILAGGKSSRMGQDKALMQVDGRAMIVRVAEVLKRECYDVAIISNRASNYRFLNLPVIQDALPSRGPLVGIYTALLHAETQYCLIVACDLPFVNAPLIRILCQKIGCHDAAVFQSSAGVEPLFAVYSKGCLQVVKNQIETGQLKVSQLFHKIDTVLVRVPSGEHQDYDRAFLNVNTPKELERARKMNR